MELSRKRNARLEQDCTLFVFKLLNSLQAILMEALKIAINIGRWDSISIILMTRIYKV